MENFTDNLIKDYTSIISEDFIDIKALVEKARDSENHRVVLNGNDYNNAKNIMQKIIETSYTKTNDATTYNIPHIRLQMFCNAYIQETTVKELCNFTDSPGHSASPVVRVGGAESGADLVSPEGKKVECKIYYDLYSAEVNGISKGTKAFHFDTEYVFMYIISKKQWLCYKKLTNNTFVETNEMDKYLNTLNEFRMPYIIIREYSEPSRYIAYYNN